MKAKFRCTIHDAPLEGYPLWIVVTDDTGNGYTIYEPSYKAMGCPQGDAEDTCSEVDWETIAE